MASLVTTASFADAVARALGQRLVSLLLYGSAASGAHVPKRSDVNTLLICDVVDEGLFDALAPALRDWTRAGHPAPLIFTEREWRESADAFPIEYEGLPPHLRLLARCEPSPRLTPAPEPVRPPPSREALGKLTRPRQRSAP